MPIHHIILLKFKQDITSADIDKVRTSLHSLPSKIPAISDIKAGHKIKHALDHDFDEGVIFIFKDEDTLKKDYSPHPAHYEYQEFTAPYIQDKLIFDIYVQE